MSICSKFGEERLSGAALSFWIPYVFRNSTLLVQSRWERKLSRASPMWRRTTNIRFTWYHIELRRNFINFCKNNTNPRKRPNNLEFVAYVCNWDITPTFLLLNLKVHTSAAENVSQKDDAKCSNIDIPGQKLAFTGNWVNWSLGDDGRNSSC